MADAKENTSQNESVSTPESYPVTKILNAYSVVRSNIMKNGNIMCDEQRSSIWALLSLLVELGIIDTNTRAAEFGAYCSEIQKLY